MLATLFARGVYSSVHPSVFMIMMLSGCFIIIIAHFKTSTKTCSMWLKVTTTMPSWQTFYQISPQPHYCYWLAELQKGGNKRWRCEAGGVGHPSLDTLASVWMIYPPQPKTLAEVYFLLKTCDSPFRSVDVPVLRTEERNFFHKFYYYLNWYLIT